MLTSTQLYYSLKLLPYRQANEVLQPHPHEADSSADISVYAQNNPSQIYFQAFCEKEYYESNNNIKGS